MRWSPLLLLAAMLMLLGAGCGSGSGPASATSADDRPRSFDELAYSSPIADFLGFGFGREDSETQVAEMERTAGRVTAECMLEQGFEYVPSTPGSVITFGVAGDELAYYSDEWVAKYGFGVSTQMFSQSQVGPDLVGYADENFDEGLEFEDPNAAYLESLSEAEREAYNEALYGAPPEVESGSEGPVIAGGPFTPTGCINEAYEQAFGGARQNEFYETFGAELEAIYERAEADPRVIAYRTGVSECVADAGHVWSPDDNPYERFSSALEDVGPQFDGDPFEAAGLDPEDMSEREIEDFFNGLNVLSDESRATLAEVQAEEIELAQVVIGCGGGELNEQYFLGDIRREYEQRFLDDNADELAPFRAEG